MNIQSARQSLLVLALVATLLAPCVGLWWATSWRTKQELADGLHARDRMAAIAEPLERDERRNSRHQDKSTSDNIKILCWVLTIDSPENRAKSEAVSATWGRRCDKLVLVRNQSVELRASSRVHGRNSQEILTIPMAHESRAELWHKVVAASKHLYEKHLNHYDWFLKADDDTYIIVDNLRNFLAQNSSPDQPIYFGQRFKPFVRQGYMSGGSGYVMSRRALQLLVEQGIGKRKLECHLLEGQVEDVEMGLCLESVGVRAGDSRDSQGRPRFLSLSPLWLLSQQKLSHNFWYYYYGFYGPPKEGKSCCSDEPISFHYIDPMHMRLIDWLLEDVKRNGKH